MCSDEVAIFATMVQLEKPILDACRRMHKQ